MVDGVVPELGGWVQVAVEAQWWLLAAAGATAAMWVTTAGWWRRRAARVLHSRHAVRVVPAQGFDPALGEVLGVAPRLHRLPQPAGLLPRRARAVRIQVTSAEGLLEYRLHAPADAAHVLDMPLYPGVEVRRVGATEREVSRIRLTASPSPSPSVSTGEEQAR